MSAGDRGIEACGSGHFESATVRQIIIGLCGVVLLVLLWTGLGSRMVSRAREEKKAADAKQVLRDIRSAEAAFKNRAMRYGTLRELIEAGHLSTALADGSRSEYQFSVSSTANTYQAIASPAKRDDANLGTWSFFLDESGIIRGAPFWKRDGYWLAGKDDLVVRHQWECQKFRV